MAGQDTTSSTVEDDGLQDPTVCVPLVLDAFILNEKLCGLNRSTKVPPLNRPDYSGLGHGSFLRPDILPAVDLHTASPASINSRISNISTGKVRQDRLGVYIHWILPKAFRSGIAATESAKAEHDKRRFEHGYPAAENRETQPTDTPDFRPVPDRWLVFRFIAKAVKPDGKEADEQEVPPISAFAIESNRIRQLNELPLDRDVETEAAAFLDTSQEAHEQDDVLMGFKGPLQNWTDGQANETIRYSSPLTVINSSNPLFADY
ncbi:hypothetical protein MMC18_008549 [Xylographa bjoerkii]|nr:hypothetical protein [Xylographa bjoerkii]